MSQILPKIGVSPTPGYSQFAAFMSNSGHRFFMHPIPQFTSPRPPPTPRPVYIKNLSNSYTQNIISNTLKSVLNGTLIERASVFNETLSQSLGYLTSSTFIKRNLRVTENLGLCCYVIRSFYCIRPVTYSLSLYIFYNLKLLLLF